MESFAALTDLLADAFVRESVAGVCDVLTTLWRRYDVRKFDAGVREKSCVRKRKF